MIQIKTDAEIAVMRRAGLVVARTLEKYVEAFERLRGQAR